MALILCGSTQKTETSPGPVEDWLVTHDHKKLRIAFWIDEQAVLNPKQSYFEADMLDLNGLYMPLTNGFYPEVGGDVRLMATSTKSETGTVYTFAIRRWPEGGGLTMTTNTLGPGKTGSAQIATVTTARCAL